ncbi:hypothetical protein [Tsukamurella hominis]|uniref:hypothetical protein n=1 Tax=Tsukamurella hominis TaxID=1970232 RepID=UPI0039EC5CC6
MTTQHDQQAPADTGQYGLYSPTLTSPRPMPQHPPMYQQPYPAQPYMGAPMPPQRPRRRIGLVIGIIAAVLLIIALTVIGTLVVTRSTTDTTPTAETTSAAAAPTTAAKPTLSAADAQGVTCVGVKLSISMINASPVLPQGWTQDTPNIAALMAARRQGMIDAKARIVVEPGTPESVATVVRAYADAEQALIDRAYITTPFGELMQYATRADTAGAAAYTAACGK